MSIHTCISKQDQRFHLLHAMYIIHKLNFGTSKMIMKMEYVKNRMFIGDKDEQLQIYGSIDDIE